jgi:hypothetical protein
VFVAFAIDNSGTKVILLDSNHQGIARTLPNPGRQALLPDGFSILTGVDGGAVRDRARRTRYLHESFGPRPGTQRCKRNGRHLAGQRLRPY